MSKTSSRHVNRHMVFIKLDYEDYRKISELMENVEDLSAEERVTQKKVDGILLLMENKRQLENRGVIPIHKRKPARAFTLRQPIDATVAIPLERARKASGN